MTITDVIVQLRTTNIDESLDFYISKLGFELEFRYEDFYAGIRAGQHLIHFKLVDVRDPSIDFVSSGEHFHLYFTIDDAQKEARDIKKKGISFHKKITETPWGTKEFYIRDSQGHVLCFSEPV